MAYRISATTDQDREVLQQIREMAWRNRQPVSTVIREALESHLDLETLVSGGPDGKGQTSLSPRRFEPRKKA